MSGTTFDKVGNVCDECKKDSEEVGMSKQYTTCQGIQKLLCKNCTEKHKKIDKEICPKCKQLAWKHGGMSTYDNPPNKPKKMCSDCVDDEKDKKKKNDTRNLKIWNFVKKYSIPLAGFILLIIFGLHNN